MGDVVMWPNERLRGGFPGQLNHGPAVAAAAATSTKAAKVQTQYLYYLKVHLSNLQVSPRQHYQLDSLYTKPNARHLP